MIIYLRVVPGLWVAVEEQRRPELRSRPIVMGGLPHERGVVHEANILAQQAGVRAGMTLSQAHQQCPDGIFLTPDLSRYGAAWQQVCDVLRMHTPLVEPLEMGEAVCDVSGCERQWGGAWDMARQIAWDVESTTGIASWLGVASNRLVAQLASMSVGADGITIVPKGQEARFLADLPITLLPEVDPRLALTFQVLGLRSIGQFAALPASSVKQRFGVIGEKLHRFSRGIDSRKVIPPAAKSSVTARYECEEGSWEEAMGAIHRLAERCAGELQQRRVAGKLVELVVESEVGRRKTEVARLTSHVASESEVGSRRLEGDRAQGSKLKAQGSVEGLPVPYRIHSMLPQPSPESRVLVPERRTEVREGRDAGTDYGKPEIFRPPPRGAVTDCHATWDRAMEGWKKGEKVAATEGRGRVAAMEGRGRVAAMEGRATSVVKSSATVRTPIDTVSLLVERAQEMLVGVGHEAWGLRHEGYGKRYQVYVDKEDEEDFLKNYVLQAIELTVSEFEAPSQLSFEEFNRIDQTGRLSGLDAGRLKALGEQEEVLIARHGETPFRHVIEVDPVNVLAERRFRWEEGLLGRR